jgi:hypothetical protein
MLVELWVMAMLGDDPPLISVERLGRGLSEELSKQIDAVLLAGHGFIIFDNLRSDIGLIPKLTALSTAAKVSIRLFHTQKQVEVPNSLLVLVSGNNMTIEGRL